MAPETASREPLFSDDEARIVTNPAPFLLRTSIRGKIKATFGGVRERLREEMKRQLREADLEDPFELFSCPASTDFERGKLSHGDNFKALPWVYLDFPRSLGKADRFLFRTFFWWGNFIACGWILDGSLLEGYREKFHELAGRLPPGRYATAFDPTPWEWGSDRDSMVQIRERTLETLRSRTGEIPYLKVFRMLPLSSPTLSGATVVEECERTFRELAPIVLRRRSRKE